MFFKKVVVLCLAVMFLLSIFPTITIALTNDFLSGHEVIREKNYKDAEKIIQDLLRKNLITPAMATEMLANLDQLLEMAKRSDITDFRDVNAIMERLLKDQTYLTPEQIKEIRSIIEGSLGLVRVTGVRLDNDSLILPLGFKETITATVYPSNAVNKEVYWQTEDALIVSIDGKGRSVSLIAESPGITMVTVGTRDGHFKANCLVEVVIPVSDLTVEPEKIELNIGNEADLKAIVLPLDATNKNITWLSTNPAVASVDNFGRVQAMKIGESRIIARSEQDETIAAYCQLSVVEKGVFNLNIFANMESKTLLMILGGLGVAAIIAITGFLILKRNQNETQ